MTTPILVSDFYNRIWGAGDRSALAELLSEGFTFRGSLGPEVKGQDSFWKIVSDVRLALSDYHCEIVECVAEDARAFAKMKFSGLHIGMFRGYPPTGLPVQWQGAALFRFELGRICELWVLSDIAALDGMLLSNSKALSAGKIE